METLETQFEIIPLFPTPLYTNTIPKQLVLDHVSLLNGEKMKKEGSNNNFGSRSKDSYILNNDSYKNLSSYILQHATNLAQNYLSYNYKSYKFSQSWISQKHQSQSHTPHAHYNSLISGILFFDNLAQDYPPVDFYNEVFPSFNSSHPKKPERDLNQFSYTSYSIPHQENKLLLFPSYLKHGVTENTSPYPRKSLAFNIVPTEGFGSEEGLTELKFN
jgi:uncharacterized protein (TIGR02466 family)